MAAYLSPLSSAFAISAETEKKITAAVVLSTWSLERLIRLRINMVTPIQKHGYTNDAKASGYIGI
jgi:hypothetical protein